MKYLNKIIEEIDVEGFDIDEFKSLTSFKKRVNYCNNNLQIME